MSMQWVAIIVFTCINDKYKTDSYDSFTSWVGETGGEVVQK